MPAGPDALAGVDARLAALSLRLRAAREAGHLSEAVLVFGMCDRLLDARLWLTGAGTVRE